MASISSLMGSSSSSSSIYGSRNSNIISGLASGLDTESMIEGMVQSYKQKIQSLQQDRTKLQWQQSGYQSISDKLVEFSRKYTSYTSTTNLLSNTFFNNAVITSAKGTYADLVTASGKSSSNIVLNAVKQLATSAQYSVANKLGASSINGQITVSGSEKLALSDKTTLSTMDGSLTLAYGTQSVTLNFGELELFEKDGSLDTEALQKAVNEKLEDQEITIDGNTYKASECITATVGSDGTVTLSDAKGAGNSVYIKGASGNLASFVNNLDTVVKNKSGTFGLNTSKSVTKEVDTAEYLSDKTLSVTLNGQTKQIKLDNLVINEGDDANQVFLDALNEKLGTAFGDGKIKADLDSEGKLSFTVKSSDTLSVNSSAGELMGIGDETLTSYLDTSKSLGDLLGENMGGLKPLQAEGDKDKITEKDGNYYDEAGNRVDKDGNRLDSDGKKLYALTINGVEIGQYTKDTAMETVVNAINSNSEAGVNVSYSKLTNEFVFTAKETGEGGRIEITNEDGTNLGAALFGTVDPDTTAGYTKGQDAEFIATVNGSTQTFTRSSNSVDLDGLKVTLDGTFDPVYVKDDQGQDTQEIDKTQGVTFSTKTDTDTLVEAIKQMVNDYNTMVTEVKKAYSDMPLQKSNGSRYEPLTSDDEEGMTESEIKAYEEKAKTGILFMDRDLSSLYSELRSAVTPSGTDGSYLRSIGINTSYSDGLTTISLDESALRQALETDLDGVRNAFTKSKESGSATDGLMTTIQKVTDKYAATTGATKGILIKKAGSQYSPTAALDNTMLDKMEDIDEQIEKWQDKMSDKVDYYTNKFTQLEMLINQMNSQSSALAGLMGNG